LGARQTPPVTPVSCEYTIVCAPSGSEVEVIPSATSIVKRIVLLVTFEAEALMFAVPVPTAVTVPSPATVAAD
jgi:hypothetical protein